LLQAEKTAEAPTRGRVHREGPSGREAADRLTCRDWRKAEAARKAEAERLEAKRTAVEEAATRKAETERLEAERKAAEQEVARKAEAEQIEAERNIARVAPPASWQRRKSLRKKSHAAGGWQRPRYSYMRMRARTVRRRLTHAASWRKRRCWRKSLHAS
jgi:hypothetical protein